MTQIQAIELAERVLANNPDLREFVIPFASRRDFDRADDALTDIGCFTSETELTEQAPPIAKGVRGLERLASDFGPQLNVVALNVWVPTDTAALLRQRRQTSREKLVIREHGLEFISARVAEGF